MKQSKPSQDNVAKETEKSYEKLKDMISGVYYFDGTHWWIDTTSCLEAISKTRLELSPPATCSECGGRINKWIGSQTVVRSKYIDGSIKWFCTDCIAKHICKKQDAPPITPATKNLPTTPDKRIIDKFNEIEQAQTPKLNLKGSMRFNRGFWEELALTQLVFYFCEDARHLAMKEVDENGIHKDTNSQTTKRA